MRITPKRSIENNSYKTTIIPQEFGTVTMTAQDEIEMLKDFPQILRYADVVFKAAFKIVDGLPVISTDADAIEIKIDNLTNREFLIGEDLLIDYSIAESKIASAEVDGTIFTTALQVCQAKVILFETKILAKLKELMDKARANVNSFETATEQIL